MIIYQFIENLSRMIMEWAMKKRDENNRHIIDEMKESYNIRELRVKRVKKALL